MDVRNFEFIVEEIDAGQRIDKFLAEKFLAIKPEITRNKIQNLITEKKILNQEKNPINSSSYKVKIDDKFFVELLKAKASHLEAKEIDFEIIFEDEDLLIVNKPSGLTVHPGAGNQDNTLVNALLFTHKDSLSKVGGEFRLGIVHRLDKDTSGLMIVAKNDFTHYELSKKLKNRDIRRSYLAFIFGVIDPQKGRIESYLDRCKHNRLKMRTTNHLGRIAITNYQTKKIFCDGFASLVECKLETGRTHQIRVHLESKKHSIIGDQLYNSCKKNFPNSFNEETKNFIKSLNRQALHSYHIEFLHPRSGKEISFSIPLSQDLQKLENLLNNG
jgi:23S rRNA pseudouridine1911/1915/1917 synthase